MTYMATIKPHDIQTLGQRIRYARDAARLTQSDVARHFGIARVSVTQWENDTTRPSTDKIADLADLLDTEASWLLEAKGFPPVSRPLPDRGHIIEPHHVIPGERLVGERRLPIYVPRQAV